MIKVTAIEKGYYGRQIRLPGEVFGIASAEDFSEAWMKTDDPLDHDGDGKKGGAKKPTAAERIKLATELSGRTDIKTAKEADEIIAAAGGADDTPADDAKEADGDI
jgi:hypothetical protein